MQASVSANDHSVVGPMSSTEANRQEGLADIPKTTPPFSGASKDPSAADVFHRQLDVHTLCSLLWANLYTSSQTMSLVFQSCVFQTLDQSSIQNG